MSSDCSISEILNLVTELHLEQTATALQCILCVYVFVSPILIAIRGPNY